MASQLCDPLRYGDTEAIDEPMKYIFQILAPIGLAWGMQILGSSRSERRMWPKVDLTWECPSLTTKSGKGHFN
jgi:hypothetical protein